MFAFGRRRRSVQREARKCTFDRSPATSGSRRSCPVSRIDGSKPGFETVQLQIRAVLQGQLPSLSMSVQFIRPPEIPTLSLPSSAIGESGIWFLKAGDNGYTVLPLVDGVFVQTELFLPNRDAEAIPPLGTVDQQLLRYLVRWYLSVPSPGAYEDGLLFATTDRANAQDAINALNGLQKSTSVPHRVAGIAGAIRIGSLDALTALSSDLPTLGANSEFFQIVQAIQLYKPAGGSSLPTS
jgi:hypothetical protein